MLPASAMAQATGGAVTSFGVGEWFGLLLRLGLVVGVIWAAVYAMRWYTRRAGGEHGGAARTLDIVETRSLGPNRALHLVRIGGRAVLIGVTPERINALLEIGDPEALDHLGLTTGSATHATPTFSSLLAGFGGGGQGSKAELLELSELPAPERRDIRKGAPRFSGFRRGLRRPAAPAAPAASNAPKESRRPLMDRVLALLGFTPVESIPQTVERLRAARLAAQAAQPVSRMFPAPAVPVSPGVAVSRFAPPVIAPSATQTLRALSGYRAAQESSLSEPPARTEPSAQAEQPPVRMESVAREERIAEAQRAIVAARQKAG